MNSFKTNSSNKETVISSDNYNISLSLNNKYKANNSYNILNNINNKINIDSVNDRNDKLSKFKSKNTNFFEQYLEEKKSKMNCELLKTLMAS